MKSYFILQNLFYCEIYTRQVVPFLKTEYFEDTESRTIWDVFKKMFVKYGVVPTPDSVQMEINDLPLSEKVTDNIAHIFDEYLKKPEKETDPMWMMDYTEKWCKDRALMIAFDKSADIIDRVKNFTDKTKRKDMPSLTETVIPSLFTEALSVGFKQDLGLDHFEDVEDRWHATRQAVKKIPFKSAILNRVTNNGINRKSLNLIAGGSNVGKTAIMCSLAADYVMDGFNVVYISLEVDKYTISQRIDANLLNVHMSSVNDLELGEFIEKNRSMAGKTDGRLKVFEFPSTQFDAMQLSFLLEELKTKKGFIPDVVMIDYINLCSSTRIKLSQTGNTNTYLRCVAEEFRAVASEWDIGIWSATQFNRSGMDSSDPEMTNTADAIALAFTADFFLAAITSEQMESMDQIMLKQLKSRYREPHKDRRFIMGYLRGYQRLYDIDLETAFNGPARAMTKGDVKDDDGDIEMIEKAEKRVKSGLSPFEETDEPVNEDASNTRGKVTPVDSKKTIKFGSKTKALAKPNNFR